MRRKSRPRLKFLSCLGFAVILFLMACQGPAGPTGPQGQPGPYSRWVISGSVGVYDTYHFIPVPELNRYSPGDMPAIVVYVSIHGGWTQIPLAVEDSEYHWTYQAYYQIILDPLTSGIVLRWCYGLDYSIVIIV